MRPIPAVDKNGRYKLKNLPKGMNKMSIENKNLSTKQAYKTMLTEYPDVLDVCHVCEILKVSRRTAYKLINKDGLAHIRVGRKYKVAKIDLIKHLLGN